jgi:DNA-binding winged helix-turn-helix (wHTH) protein
MRGAESAAGNGGTLTSAEKRTPLRFAGLVLDLDSCTLARQSGEPIALTHGELALLRVFVTQPGRVLSRDTLLSALTKRRFEPFDRSVDVLIGKLRRRIELDPKQPRLVITVRGEGYRFDGLERSEPSKRTNGIAAASERDGPPRLSIVVLPFANVGNDSDQEYFIDGITESLTTDLSRIRSSFVIGRSTAFTYKGKAVDHRRIGRELNVRYILGACPSSGGIFGTNLIRLRHEPTFSSLDN